MLSDGAGALLLGNSGRAAGHLARRAPAARVHQRSFSGDYPVCMQLGLSADRQRGHLDYPSWTDAEADGALSLRQDIRLLPHLFDIGIHEYAKLVRDGWWIRTRSTISCAITRPRNSFRWWPTCWTRPVWPFRASAGSATWRGAATPARRPSSSCWPSSWKREIKPGEQLLCYIPESGRFMTAYMLFEAEAVHEQPARPSRPRARRRAPHAHSADADAIARRTIRTARRRAWRR